MSNQITTARSQEFTTRVEHLVQQMGSRLRDCVETGSHTGKQAVPVDQIGIVEAVKKQARHADLPTVEVPHARRWVIPSIYQFRDFIDNPDTLRMLWEPNNRYARAFAYALGRAMDDEIIEAFDATSTTGETGSGTETFQNQSVGTVTLGMTVTKLRQAMESFRSDEVDTDNEELFCVLASDQIEDLMSETQVISFDYNTDKVLVDGRLTSFGGFNFKHSERLGVDSNSDRKVFMWARSGMYLGLWEDIRTPIDWIAEKQAWQVAGCGDFGSTRLQLEKVVIAPCSE